MHHQSQHWEIVIHQATWTRLGAKESRGTMGRWRGGTSEPESEAWVPQREGVTEASKCTIWESAIIRVWNFSWFVYHEEILVSVCLLYLPLSMEADREPHGDMGWSSGNYWGLREQAKMKILTFLLLSHTHSPLDSDSQNVVWKFAFLRFFAFLCKMVTAQHPQNKCT